VTAPPQVPAVMPRTRATSSQGARRAYREYVLMS